jgi:hypothetical protein
MDQQLKIKGVNGLYKFLYNAQERSLCLIGWPNGESSARIIAAGLPQTLEKARLAAQNYVRYVETDFQSC